MVPGAVISLDCQRQDPRLRQIQLAGHRLERLVAFAGIVAALRHGLQAYGFAGAVKSGPQAQHSLAASDLKHRPVVKIYVAEQLSGKAGEVITMVPKTHFLAHQPEALCRGLGRRTGWNSL